jgi:hypothetical protein
VTAVALSLKRLPSGWAVERTDGRELVRFTGPGAKGRAERYATGVGREERAQRGVLSSWLRQLSARG